MKRISLAITLLAAFSFGCESTAQQSLHVFEKQQLTDVFYAEGIHAGDFNNDGIPDIVYGPHWYEGPAYTVAHEIYTPTPFDPERYSDNFFPHTYDFNQDGWDDLFLIGFPGEPALWFENPKNDGEHWARHEVFDTVDNESPHWTDLDGDGKPEIVCNAQGYFGYVSPNWDNPQETWSFHPISAQGEWQRYTHGMGVGDINGDGRMDIMDKDGWWEQPASLVGDPEWVHHPATFGEGGAQMYAYDIDGDGDNDVITSKQAHGWGLAWYENKPSDTASIDFAEHLIMGELPEENDYGVKFSQLHAVALHDMDGDGVKDIITGKRFMAHGSQGDPEPLAPAVTYWFKTVRETSGTHFIPYLIHDDVGVGVGLTLHDMQGDGAWDVLVGNKKGAFIVHHTTQQVDEDTWRAAQPTPRN